MTHAMVQMSEATICTTNPQHRVGVEVEIAKKVEFDKMNI